MDEITGVSPGTRFTYLGRPCVALRYADEGEAWHTGLFGLVYEYADDRGEIHRRAVPPREFDAFGSAISTGEKQ
jgi:hypothetical protein